MTELATESERNTVRISDLAFTYGRSSTPALEIEKLSFGSGVNFIVGLNGSGKSTLLRLLAGIEKPPRNSIFVGGQDISDSEHVKARRPVGYLRQSSTLRGRTTAADYARYALWLRGHAANAASRLADEALTTVDLHQQRDTPVSRLSGGMQRRLSFGVETADAPDLLLLDEPLSGVDHDVRALILDRVEEMAKSGTTVMIASHDAPEINFYTARITVLAQGRVRKELERNKVDKSIDLGGLLA